MYTEQIEIAAAAAAAAATTTTTTTLCLKKTSHFKTLCNFVKS